MNSDNGFKNDYKCPYTTIYALLAGMNRVSVVMKLSNLHQCNFASVASAASAKGGGRHLEGMTGNNTGLEGNNH